MNLQETAVEDYIEEKQTKHQDWPVVGICTKCGNVNLEHLTVVGVTTKYEYDMIRCYKCGTRWFM